MSSLLPVAMAHGPHHFHPHHPGHPHGHPYHGHVHPHHEGRRALNVASPGLNQGQY